MPVARLRLRITSTWVGSDSERAARSLTVATSSNSGRGFALPSMLRGSRNFRVWQKWALFLAPAAFTMGKHLVGLAAGIATLGVVAGAAAAPWIGLAVTAARNAEQMGSAGARFEAGARGVRDAWMALARSTAPLTLGPVTDVLNGIATAIPKLEPLVREVAPDMARMGRDIAGWLSGPGLERFLQNVRDYGVPAFRDLVAAGRDFMATIGIGFRQFLPLARDIADTLRSGAAAMRANAQGGGVARFLRDWRENAPTANRFLREAATTIRTLGGLLNNLGPGQLGGISTMLDLFNNLDPQAAIAAIVGIGAFLAGRRLLGILNVIRALTNLGTIAGAAAALSGAAGALSAAAGTISGMAAAISRMAASIAAMRLTFNSSALDNIKSIWDSIPKNATVTVSAPSVNTAIVAAMGISSTAAALASNAAARPVFSARVDAAVFNAVAGILLGVWVGVRAIALAVPVFTAVASPGAALTAMAAITVAWARVRALATIPVVFTATATPGNVSAVASQIIAAWARVRAASASRPVFTATAINTVTAGAAVIVAAWMRVTSMPKTWIGIGIVNPGNVPGASSRIVSSWRQVLSMARSWSGVATCSFSGGFTGFGIPTGHVIGGGQPLQGGYGPLPGSILNNLPGDFGEIDFGDVYVTGPGDLDPFRGGFGGATGGLVGYRGITDAGFREKPVKSRTVGGVRHVDIYEDVRVGSKADFAKFLEDVLN